MPASPVQPSSAEAPRNAAPAVPAATAENPGTPADAVRRYYAAIDAHDYRAAYALWGDNPQSYDQFAAGFAETQHVAVDVSGDVRGGGAAGSVFATVPVTVHATTAAGRAQTFRGTYQMRRVNGVDGATEAQLMWHIEQADLREVR